ADDAALRATGAGPERVAGVLGEHQVMGREAGPDQRDLPGLRVVHGEMAVGLLKRKQLRRRMVRTSLTELRIGGRTDARGKPDPASFVEHGIVHAGLAV